MRTGFGLAVLLLTITTAVAAFGAKPKQWPSPNRVLIASAMIRFYPDKPDRQDLTWDEVSFTDAKKHQLASLSLEEGTGINRALVSEAFWSSDSRFFVFSTWSSGGHSSWHSPTYVYDAATSHIYSIDDTIKPVTEESDTKLQLTNGDTLKIRFWDGENVRPEATAREIDLIEFVRKGPKMAMGAHRSP